MKVNVVNNNGLTYKVLKEGISRTYDVTLIDSSIEPFTFSYPEKEMKQYNISGDFAISGSVQNGQWGIVKGNNYYSSEISKSARAWNKNSPFWENWGPTMNLLLDDKPIVKFTTPVNLWFQINLYWHWFNEDIPQIDFFRTNDYPIITNTLSDWQKQSLDFFPDIKERIIELNGPHIVKAKEFFVYTYPAISLRGKTSKWVTDFLQKNIVPTNNNLDKKVYISRGDAQARVVENEDEVKDFLKTKGFTCIDNFSSYSIQEKINIFYSADIVCSPTGAGLTHCHAMRPNTTVIDFNHPFELTKECGWNNIGTAAGVNWITCRANTGSPSLRSKAKGNKRKNHNLLADIKLLDLALQHAMD